MGCTSRYSNAACRKAVSTISVLMPSPAMVCSVASTSSRNRPARSASLPRMPITKVASRPTEELPE